MAQSPPRSGQPPIQQLQTVADLLETPALARIYAHILQHGPVTVSDLVGDLDVPQGTAYDYVQNLETAGLVEKTREQRPYEYDAESIALTLSTDGETQTITPALIAAVARRDEDITEKTDTALVGLAAQVLDTGEADHVVLLTTDKPAG